VDPLERVKKLRKDYERALDTAESRRAAYHAAVVDLIEHGGPHLRELADQLGVLDHPEPQIASRPRARRGSGNLARAIGGVAGVLVLAALTLGVLWVAHAPPFVQKVQVPRVLNLPEAAAIRRIEDAGLKVRIVSLRRRIPRSLSRHVFGVSNTPDERIAKGSTVTLYVAVRRTGHAAKRHS
jgi:hypothetical protein